MLGLASSGWMLFLSRIIDGISGANIATAQAAITDSTTEKTRTQGLGLIGAAFGLGFIIGPVIAYASLALSGNDYRAPAFAAAFFSLLSILLTSFWFKETLPEEKRGKGSDKPAFSFKSMFSAIAHPTVGILLILIFAQQLAFGGFEQLLALFTLSNLGFNASGNAIIFVYVGVLVVAVQGYFIGKWSRRFGDRRLGVWRSGPAGCGLADLWFYAPPAHARLLTGGTGRRTRAVVESWSEKRHRRKMWQSSYRMTATTAGSVWPGSWWRWCPWP